MPRTDATGSGLWPTPISQDSKHSGTAPSGPGQAMKLSYAVQEPALWPTPNVPNGGRSVAHVEDWRGSTAYHKGKKVQVGLEAAVKLWPTPSANDNRDRGHLGMPAIQRRMAKGKQLNLGMVVSTTSGALNPAWVEWLMGFPEGWTGCAPSETR